MNRVVIALLTGTAAAAIGVPAVIGLSGNPSFSRSIPVSVPSQAQVAHFAEHSSAAPSATRAKSRSAAVEPGDDRGTHSEPGDDRRGKPTTSGTDDGGHRGRGGSGRG